MKILTATASQSSIKIMVNFPSHLLTADFTLLFPFIFLEDEKGHVEVTHILNLTHNLISLITDMQITSAHEACIAFLVSIAYPFLNTFSF
jgi:hypothetical protein